MTALAPPSPPPTLPRGSASPSPALLFTAFEPSGDDHAAVVINELRRRHPSLRIYAWGGPKMERAGATLVERTTHDAVVGIPGAAKILEHIKINRRIDDWLDRNRIDVHIPVDSPDANFPVCALTKAHGARVVHLVAPQLWAWREGRIRKLRRLTNLVLCLLPFEEQWFLSRGVPAKFVGHPLFEETLDYASLDRLVASWPTGSPKIALMPGSRPGEISKCFPLILEAFRRIKQDLPGATGVIPITHPGVEQVLQQMAAEGGRGGWVPGMHVVAGNTDAAVRWCDVALVASGTVTLQVARQIKPMVAFYRFSHALRLPYELFGKRVFKTPYFTLPNLIVGRGAVPEYIPYWGKGPDLSVGIYRLLRQPGFADQQRAALRQIVTEFENHRCGSLSADAIEQMAGIPAA